MWKDFRDLAFRFFGKTLDPYVNYFDSIKGDLQKADIPLSLIEYVYVMSFISFIFFVVEFPLFVVITSIIFNNAALAFLFSFTLTIIISLGIFFLFYTYPSLQVGSRKKSIDGALPFATTYMSTVAASGAPPQTMFKVLAKFKEYGEISKEAEKINRDIEAFGMDLIGAIRKNAARSPSPTFKELLWGLENALTTGASVSDFLHERSRLLMQDYRRQLQQFSQTLSLLIEVYLTVVIVGTIFFIIMSSLMSIFGGADSGLSIVFTQFMIIFVGLPVISAGFVMLLKVMSPAV